MGKTKGAAKQSTDSHDKNVKKLKPIDNQQNSTHSGQDNAKTKKFEWTQDVIDRVSYCEEKETKVIVALPEAAATPEEVLRNIRNAEPRIDPTSIGAHIAALNKMKLRIEANTRKKNERLGLIEPSCIQELPHEFVNRSIRQWFLSEQGKLVSDSLVNRSSIYGINLFDDMSLRSESINQLLAPGESVMFSEPIAGFSLLPDFDSWIWHPCYVVGVTVLRNPMFNVVFGTDNPCAMEPIHVCLTGMGDKPFSYFYRVKKALVLRLISEDSCRLSISAQSMPIFPELIRPLSDAVASRISSRSRGGRSHLCGFKSFEAGLMNQVRERFQQDVHKRVLLKSLSSSSSSSSIQSKVISEFHEGHLKQKTYDFNSVGKSARLALSGSSLKALLLFQQEAAKLSHVKIFEADCKNFIKTEDFKRKNEACLNSCIRLVKMEWPFSTGRLLRSALERDSNMNVNIQDVSKYMGSGIKIFLDMICYRMTAVVEGVVVKNIDGLSNAFLMEDAKSIILRTNSSLCLELTYDDMIGTLLFPFDKCVTDFSQAFHVQRHVMEKLYMPTVAVVNPLHRQTEHISKTRNAIVSKLQIEYNKSSAVADEIRSKWKWLMDIEIKALNMSHVKINVEDGGVVIMDEAIPWSDVDVNVDDMPIVIDVRTISVLLSKHKNVHAEIKEQFSRSIIVCGMFCVDISEAKNSLLQKNTAITNFLLDIHARLSCIVSRWIDLKFLQISSKLASKPTNIEQVVEMEDLLSSSTTGVNALMDFVAVMMTYFSVLDEFGFKMTSGMSNAKWSTYGWLARISTQMEKVVSDCVSNRSKYGTNVEDDNEMCKADLKAVESQVTDFCEEFTDILDCEAANQTALDIDARIAEIETRIKLINSRQILLNTDVTEYDTLSKTKKLYEPYGSLWKSASVWLNKSSNWKSSRFNSLNSEEVETLCDQLLNAVSKSAKFFEKSEKRDQVSIANEIKSQLIEFKPVIPVIVALRNAGMRERHWTALNAGLKLSEQDMLSGDMDDETTLEKVMSLNLETQLEFVEKIAEGASKEFQIEKALDKMMREWVNIKLDIVSYRDTGTSVLKGVDEIISVLDEHVTMTQAMQFSSFKGPFEARIEEWNRKLYVISEVLEAWINVQRNWLYLQPIFDSADINRQLPTEGKMFSNVDKSWRQVIASAKANPLASEFCDNEKLLERFKDGVAMLERVQKGLSDYLETKRSVFSRFYFLSNDELLSILSESKDIMRVQPHLKKCFEGIDQVRVREGNFLIDAMISPEGELVNFTSIVDPKGKNVEEWMSEVEQVMKHSVKEVMRTAIVTYTNTPRPKWMQSHAGMFVINGSQLHWTKETEELLDEHGIGGPKIMFERELEQLKEMVVLVRGELGNNARTTVGALMVIDVHARDVMQKLVNERVSSKQDFVWASQLRYYWQDDNLFADMVASRRPYGYEYLGNSFRLVITPLTDKCYLTLMGALQMILGGAPAGPAGTGKTETVKDLSKALAMQCVVFNCSDGLDYLAMGKFFKGLANCGAWSCFDEFNRINIEVLSVIGQQIMTLQLALKSHTDRINFEGCEITVNRKFGVFITMNPGYAGRTELPDSLKALFRPVAMMVPDYALIGEIMFIAFGFGVARECGQKMVTTFKLCSEQLSSQPHYDYGMRAVKTVITAAGNLKRAEPNCDEMILLLRALQDVNIPKFLEMDLPLFNGIISDLFPGKVRPQLDYGAFMSTMKQVIEEKGLEPVPFFTTKVIQLYEMIIVRHGLMLVGPTGGGKTSNLHTLEETLGNLKKQSVKGFAYEKVIISQLNPKSITMGQMYGAFDENTHEWQDGIMSTMYRRAASSQSKDRKWIMFNGPVDAIWIENMNTVLDDNKKLCLNSGEIVKMSPEMTMMFEVEDLAVASPATVSRVGIIFMEPKSLGLDVLVETWLKTAIPACLDVQVVINRLCKLMDLYIKPSLWVLRQWTKELVITVDSNLTQSLFRIMDCFLEPFFPKEGRDLPAPEARTLFVERIEAMFIFSLIWSIGACVNEEGRTRFDAFIRSEMASHDSKFLFPSTVGQGKSSETPLVYDFSIDVDTGKWVQWMTLIDPFTPDPKAQFHEVIVPTVDSVRSTYLLDLLGSNNNHVLFVGPTGTGKTINISQYLMGSAKIKGKPIGSNVIPLGMTFSAQTSANMTQDFLDSKMDKRRKGVYGPPAGRTFMIHIDDLNMPKREKYGAQPPIELLRQWFDQGGWYDRKDLSFRKIIDIILVGSMGPPGGGRQTITGRFLRHFNIIGCTDMSKQSKKVIFGSILKSYLTPFEGNLVRHAETIVDCSIDVFETICKQLLPTPSKAHYSFNLRDLAKVVQGIMMCDVKKVNEENKLLRLWVHECKRVFDDRLTCKEDHTWFKNLMSKQLEKQFGASWEMIIPSERLVYVDYQIPGADPKIYDEVTDLSKLKGTVEEYLGDYNADSKNPMHLVLFSDALEHVARIVRILRQPQGNALLLGVGGSGRQSMTRLASYIAGYKVFQVEICKGYGLANWREDIKRCLLSAGLKETQTTFLFTDSQIISETMLEDVNNILNAGDVPNLYAAEDIDAITVACKIDCQKKRLAPTKLNIFAQYINRVRRNIHICLCMSPVGDIFRERLRMFPSLGNCCTIDWFTEWPAEALESVGMSTMTNYEGQFPSQLIPGIVEMFRFIHQTVEEKSVEYWDVLRRKNYVTPTSYLQLLSSFKTLIETKREQVSSMRQRLQIGINKLSTTKVQVATMQAELIELQPILVKTQQEVAAMMEIIKRDKEEAAVTKAKVEVEERNANEKAASAKEIADDAQRDLDEALPALAQAVQCLNDLKKSDIDEVKSMRTPPEGVRLTMLVCCHMFDIKPIKKNDPNTPGKKIDDFWEASQKGLLNDAKGFLQMLFEYDKDNISEKVIQKIEPFMEMEEFTPANVSRASLACTAMCMWARAMHKYYYVSLSVAPKKQRLHEAEAELAIVMAILKDAKDRLAVVMARLAELEANFEAAVIKKDMLEKKEAQCKMQLGNAEKLIGGLGGEEVRWIETVSRLDVQYENLVGDILVSSGTISYLGPFTMDFRSSLVRRWLERCAGLRVPHSPGTDLEKTLADPVKLRTWQIYGLPTDAVSTQNGIIMDKAKRWPLLIDPQGQANKFIKIMGKVKDICECGMDVIKLSDKNFLRTLENGVQFGRWILLENIAEELDAALEPILLQQTFKQGGQDMIKIGDNTIPFNNSFRFFMTTKLANPHYPPEVQVKVSLLNFTITLRGLEEQLLGAAVNEEMPELAKKKNELVISNAQMNKQLFDIESKILHLLQHSEGNILDDTKLIDILAQAKVTSEEIKAKMREAEETEREIETSSESYRPIANRGSLLYFCISDMAVIDPMYQYSLNWFKQLYVRAFVFAQKNDDAVIRVANLIEFFTYSLYTNICRSLFERHKLLFSFLLTIKLLQGNDLVNPDEWRFLLSGVCANAVVAEMPQSDWLEPNMWRELCSLSMLPAFKSIIRLVTTNMSAWKGFVSAQVPQLPLPLTRTSTMALTSPDPNKLTPLQFLCVLRCFRKDKLSLAIQELVSEQMHQKYIEPPPFDLRACYADSTVTSPLIFVLSQGSDPNKDLLTLAAERGMTDKLRAIALGQGQGAKASAMITKGIEKGEWILLQNCHLSVSWMPELERVVEELDASKTHPEFRLWLTSMPSKAFPASVLQNGVKMTKEPPKGMRANLKSTILKFNDSVFMRTKKPAEYRKLLFGLCFFHAVVIERKKFGPLGWNIPYEFNDTDFDISQAQLELYLDQYDEIPFKVLKILTAIVNYGGRITDDKDMRTCDILIGGYFCPDILLEEHAFSNSGVYRSIESDPKAPFKSYVDYVDSLPLNADPEVFGMHSNANITCAIAEADDMFELALSMQPRLTGSKGMSREDVIIQQAKAMLARLPPVFRLEEISMRFPTDYNESLNTVLVQELARFNSLLVVMHKSLADLQLALVGLVVLSSELESTATAIYDQRVSEQWSSQAYPSLKPLGPWYEDLLMRLNFFSLWVDSGKLPTVFWISGFFFPQGFMTANLQNHARKYRMPIDTVTFNFVMINMGIKQAEEKFSEEKHDGIYVHGLFLEGARWDSQLQSLVEPKPKELFSPLPIIHLLPEQYRNPPQGGIYRCPVYKVLTRTGVLSTTGHSTNFVFWLEVPSNKITIWRDSLVSETNMQIKFCDQESWIKAGVAAFCSLRY